MYYGDEVVGIFDIGGERLDERLEIVVKECGDRFSRTTNPTKQYDCKDCQVYGIME